MVGLAITLTSEIQEIIDSWTSTGLTGILLNIGVPPLGGENFQGDLGPPDLRVDPESLPLIIRENDSTS